MNLKSIIYFGCLYLLLVGIASASSKYGSIEVYYNDQILPGQDIAKPTLKIGEPFKIKIELSLNQTSSLFLEVCSLGGDFFKVVDGPSDFEKTKYIQSLDPGKHIFEWTIVPTDEWAGGSIPINIWYQINLPEEDEPAVKGEFTVAYCTISNEYYEGEAPDSQEKPVSETKSSPTSTSPSTPAFTFVGAISFFALAFALIRR